MIPTFCLALAKLIYPNNSWDTIRGEFHTTIVNEKRTMVFDILYFDENDKTFGCKRAFYDAISVEKND